MKGKKKQKEPAGMNPAEIFAALEMLEKERNIPQSFLMDKIVQALTTAYKRDHEDVENVIVEVDNEHKDLRMYVQKMVVAEEDYVDPANEMTVEEAKTHSARYEVGDTVSLRVPTVEFGRIAAGNGKQVIIQGLREAERGMVYDEFNSKQHEILTGVVTRIDPRNGNVSLRIGTGTESTEALLMAGEQVKGEELVEGMHVKVYVVEVRRSTRGPQVLISRTHPGLVKRLFELEVPEIYDGTVEVKAIAREAGSRTKMAVASNDPNVDPIGACVGPKGQRVDSIVEELRGEKIDIIKFSEDPAAFIAAALAPADVLDVWMADEGKACRVIVPDDQLSLAIGKEGQNARLAARLTGYKIDIKPESWHEGDDAEEAGEAAEAPAEETAEAPAESSEE
jgi:N utilization substance protein A